MQINPNITISIEPIYFYQSEIFSLVQSIFAGTTSSVQTQSGKCNCIKFKNNLAISKINAHLISTLKNHSKCNKNKLNIKIIMRTCSNP